MRLGTERHSPRASEDGNGDAAAGNAYGNPAAPYNIYRTASSAGDSLVAVTGLYNLDLLSLELALPEELRDLWLGQLKNRYQID